MAITGVSPSLAHLVGSNIIDVQTDKPTMWTASKSDSSINWYRIIHANGNKRYSEFTIEIPNPLTSEKFKDQTVNVKSSSDSSVATVKVRHPNT